MQTLTRWIVRATLPLTLLFAACDSEEPVDGRSADVVQGSLTADEAQDRGHHGPPWEKICALASCSDAQVDQVAALFKAHRPDRPGDRPARDPDAFKAENAELAAKVRAGSLSAADLAAHRQAIHAGKPAKGPKGDMGAILVGLHKIMTPEQRGVLADAFLSGHGGALGRLGGGHHEFGGWDHDGEGHGKRGMKGEGKFEGKGEGKFEGKGGHGKLKGIGKLCKIAECSDEQRTNLQAIAERSREAGKAQREQAKATREAANKALADAFRGDAFDQGAIDRFHSAQEPLHQAKMQAMDQLVIDALAVFDDAQRGKIATVVEEKGMRALMPGKKGKHGKRGMHGKKGRKGKRGMDQERSDDIPA